VDTYAVLAAATDSLTPAAAAALMDIKSGRVRGVIHYLVAYEVFYHWRRGRLPGFAAEGEVGEYLKTAFASLGLNHEVAGQAARVKAEGDSMLEEAKDPSLRPRRLSSCDATTIALGKLFRMPILSGDKDLIYVARAFDLEVVW